MPQKTRNELKELFKTGAKPSGDDFKAFIDSTLNTTDDGIAKASGADTSLKINAQGTDEKLLDFYTGETKTWSINQKPADDKSGLNIATPGGSKLFIDSSSGNVGVGTTSPGAKLEINGNLKLQSGVAVNEFSIDGTLAGNSDLAIPTEKAVKSYADTKALLAGSSSQSFSANNLTVNGNVGVGTTSPGAKLEINGDLKLQSGVAVNEFSTDGTLAGNSDLVIPTEKAVKSYVTNRINSVPLSGSSSQNFSANNLTVNGNVGIGTMTPSMKLEVNGVVMQKLDVIDMNVPRNAVWHRRDHPVPQYFYNKLHGKPVGSMILAMTNDITWKRIIFEGRVDINNDIQIKRMTHDTNDIYIY